MVLLGLSFQCFHYAPQKFKLGIPIPDMRPLDPNLLTSETGKILVRDNAIVFSVEHVRLIISATHVIIPRDGFEHNPINVRFNALLEDSIIEAAHEAQHRAATAATAADTDAEDSASGGDCQCSEDPEIAYTQLHAASCMHPS